jgi:hypothetical protein
LISQQLAGCGRFFGCATFRNPEVTRSQRYFRSSKRNLASTHLPALQQPKPQTTAYSVVKELDGQQQCPLALGRSTAALILGEYKTKVKQRPWLWFRQHFE